MPYAYGYTWSTREDFTPEGAMHRFSLDADNSEVWPYLYNRQFPYTRHLMAKGLLDSYRINTVMEVGGYVSPVCVLDRSNRFHINVDPFVSSVSCRNTMMIKSPAAELKYPTEIFRESPGPRAVVALGIDYPGSERMSELTHDTDLYIFESPHTYDTGTSQMSDLVERVLSDDQSFRKIMDFNIDDNTDHENPNAKSRHMVVLARQDLIQSM